MFTYNAYHIRSINPGAGVESDVVSKITSAFDVSGRGLIHGLIPSVQTVSSNLVLSSGALLKDFIVIAFPSDIVIDLTLANADSTYYVCVDYIYDKNANNIASIVLVTDTELNINRHVIICKLTIDSDHNILTIDTSVREKAAINNYID